MNFNLSREHQMIRKMMAEFTEKEVKPIAAETDRTCEYPRENIEKLFNLGVMGMCVPKEYGGAGARTGQLVADIFNAYYAMKDGTLTVDDTVSDALAQPETAADDAATDNGTAADPAVDPAAAAAAAGNTDE